MDPRVKPEGDGWCVEETWELAALVMLHQSNYLMHPSGSAEQKALVENCDWSGRHVRLKYQMIISALVLYLIVCTEITGLNLFGIILYDNEFPKELFIWMLFSFSLFSILAFILRSVFESSRWSSLRKDMSNLVANIRANEELARDVFKSDKNRVFAVEIVKLIEEPNDEFSEEFNSKFEQLNFEVREGSLNHFRGAISDISNDVKDLRNRLEHMRPGYHPKLTEYENSLSKISYAISTVTHSAENVERDLKEISSGPSRHRDIFNNLLRYRNAIVEISKFLPELEPKSKFIQRDEKIRHLIYFGQNVGFSVILPLLAAIGSIALSIIHNFPALVPS